MPDIPHAIVNALGPLGALLLGLTVWLFIIGTPVALVLLLRFLWRPTVYVRPTPELWAMLREWQRTAERQEQAPRAPQASENTHSQPGERHVALSMFGR